MLLKPMVFPQSYVGKEVIVVIVLSLMVNYFLSWFLRPQFLYFLPQYTSGVFVQFFLFQTLKTRASMILSLFFLLCHSLRDFNTITILHIQNKPLTQFSSELFIFTQYFSFGFWVSDSPQSLCLEVILAPLIIFIQSIILKTSLISLLFPCPTSVNQQAPQIHLFIKSKL